MERVIIHKTCDLVGASCTSYKNQENKQTTLFTLLIMQYCCMFEQTTCPVVTTMAAKNDRLVILFLNM